MRALVAVALLAMTALAVPTSGEWVGHCVAQDACTGVDAGEESTCVYNGQGRGTALIACTDGRDVTVTRCEAGAGCRDLP